MASPIPLEAPVMSATKVIGAAPAVSLAAVGYTVARTVSQSTLALITVPFVTGVIGYVTNWTGVLMLFYPVHFKGVRAPWLQAVSRLLPYKLRQVPGVMIGGIGLAGDRALARGQDGQPGRRQRDRQARHAAGVL